MHRSLKKKKKVNFLKIKNKTKKKCWFHLRFNWNLRWYQLIPTKVFFRIFHNLWPSWSLLTLSLLQIFITLSFHPSNDCGLALTDFNLEKLFVAFVLFMERWLESLEFIGCECDHWISFSNNDNKVCFKTENREVITNQKKFVDDHNLLMKTATYDNSLDNWIHRTFFVLFFKLSHTTGASQLISVNSKQKYVSWTNSISKRILFTNFKILKNCFSKFNR